MAKAIITLPETTYTPNTRQVNLPNLTTDDNGVSIEMTRVNWQNTGGVVMSGVIEGSDDGVAWLELTRFAWFGGNQVNPRTGLPVTSQKLSVYWPERYVNGVTIPQRPAQVRATITNLVSLTTAITLVGV